MVVVMGSFAVMDQHGVMASVYHWTIYFRSLAEKIGGYMANIRCNRDDCAWIMSNGECARDKVEIITKKQFYVSTTSGYRLEGKDVPVCMGYEFRWYSNGD